MSSGPRTVVGSGIYGTGAASKVGYLSGSDGTAPLSHAGMFSGARSNCRLSLLNSLLTGRGMPLTDRLERRRASSLTRPPHCSLGVSDLEARSYQKITRHPLQRRCLPAG